MALVSTIKMKTRRDCLRTLAVSIGACPPRNPIPDWWEAFDQWFDSESEAKDRGRDGVLLELSEDGVEWFAALGFRPTPTWWSAFDAWFESAKGVDTFVRTETFSYEEMGEESDILYDYSDLVDEVLAEQDEDEGEDGGDVKNGTEDVGHADP